MTADCRPGDITIVCNPCPRGDADGATFVQRFHWSDAEGRWVAKDTSGEKFHNVGGAEGPFESAEALAVAPAGRWHMNTRCRRCGDKVPMVDGRRAQAALTRLAASGLPMPVALSRLRHAYNSTPK